MVYPAGIRAFVVAAVVAAVAALSAQPRTYSHFQLERVADGVFAAIASDGYAASNAAIVDLGDSTVVFDTFMTPDAGRELRRAAADATGHDIRAVVNSHVHDDHVGGNEVFADVPILATPFTRSRLPAEERASVANAKRTAAALERDADAALARETSADRRPELEFWRSYLDAQRRALPTIHATPPDRSVEREQTLSGSRRAVRLIPLGAAHTGGDLMAYVPDAGVVLAGDIVFSHAHPYMSDGSIDGWLAALRRIARLAPRAIVPGHGQVGSTADVEAMTDYIGDLQRVAASSPPGTPLVPEKFAGWWFARFFPDNVKFAAESAAATATMPREVVPASPTPADRLDRAIAAAIQQRGGIGASVAVVEDGRTVLAKGYGRPSIDAPRAVGDETLFAVGSVTKQFTSAAVLLLAEEGRLSVEDTVAKYYPDLTRASDITLLDLMNHVSGYRDYYPLDFVDRRMMQPIAPDALLHEYAGAPLDFEPATRWSYSNTGYILLGRIVEKVTSRPLGSFLAERIFTPLGMRHTVYEADLSDVRLARGYTSFALAPLTPAVPEARGWIGSAGGIASTARDLATWDLALMQGRVLKPASWALMTKARTLADGTSTGYGCDLGVAKRGSATILSHGGAVSGFIASNTLVPETRSAVVVLLNDEDAGLMSSIVRRAMAEVGPSPPGSAQANASGRARSPKIEIAGDPPAAAARRLVAAFQRGKVDRSQLGDEYSVFLTDVKIAAAATALAPFGKPSQVDVRSVSERGGMEVASVRLRFASGGLDALMYRSPDGKVQEFLISRP